MTHHRSVHHAVMESNISEISYAYHIDVQKHVQTQVFLSFFVTSAEFSLLKASVNYLTSTVVAARICCSPLASL